MIRILHMIGSLEIGGSQSMVLNIYRNIDRDKIQFDFIVDHPDRMHLAEEIRILGGKIYIMPTFRGTNILEICNSWNLFFDQHREYRILHSHVRSYASIYLPIARKHGVKTIIHSHSTSNGKGMTAIIKDILQYPLRYQADYFMACSKEAGIWLFGKKILNNNNFFVISNAIDTEKFTYDIRTRMRIRKQLGIKDEFVLGFLGRVVPAKNPFFVLEILYNMKKQGINIKLLFVGDGELLQSVKEKAKKYNIDKNIIFTGAISNTGDMYAAMDVYCFPSFWEGLGITLVEAQASGLHCICSENVPKEAIITDLVDVMRLDEGSMAWTKKICSYREYNRKNTYQEIKAAGYDVKNNAIWFQNFYNTKLKN